MPSGGRKGSVPAISVSRSDSDTGELSRRKSHSHVVNQGTSLLLDLPGSKPAPPQKTSSTPYRRLDEIYRSKSISRPSINSGESKNSKDSKQGSLTAGRVSQNISEYDSDDPSDINDDLSDFLGQALGEDEAKGGWMPTTKVKDVNKEEALRLGIPERHTTDVEGGIQLQDLSLHGSRRSRRSTETTGSDAAVSPRTFAGAFRTLSEHVVDPGSEESSQMEDALEEGIDSDGSYDVYGLHPGANVGETLEREDTSDYVDAFDTNLEEAAEDGDPDAEADIEDVFDKRASSMTSSRSGGAATPTTPLSSSDDLAAAVSAAANANPFVEDPFANEHEAEAPEFQLYGKSLGLFSADSKLRKNCYLLLQNSSVNQAMTLLIIVQTVLLTYQEWTASRQYMIIGRYTWVDWVLLPFYVIYTLEMAIKCIAYGLWDDSELLNQKDIYHRYLAKLRGEKQPRPKTNKLPSKRAYLRDGWNRADCVSVISFWISFIMSMVGTDYRHEIPLFRSLMCIKIVRLFNMTHGTRTCIHGMRAAFAQCRDVSLFLFCFWIFFAIIGVQSFKTSLRRHCVWTNPGDSTDTYERDFQFCGSYLDPTTKASMPWLEADGSSSSQTKGFRCPVNSKCILGENPYGGTVSFDNILHSLELVFVVMSANTFTDLMYYTMDSETLAASLFFIVSIFFLTVWLLNLVVAVIINSYRAHLELMQRREKQEPDFIVVSNDRYNAFLDKSKTIKRFLGFEFIFVILILLDFVLECTKTDNHPMITHDRYYKSQFIITVILLGEIIGRFLLFVPGGFWRVFFFSTRNCIDLFLAIATLVIIIPPVHDNMGIVYGWLSIFQVFRFYRVVIAFEWVRKAWTTVFARIKPLLHLCLLFVLAIYLLGIVVARLTEGLVDPDTYLSSDQLILQNLPNVMLSLYVITSTENWTGVLYLAQQCAKHMLTRIAVAVYLIGWFIFSNIVMLNIFIAIITENLGLPDKDKKTQQVTQFYRKLVKSSESKGDKNLFDSLKNRINKSPTDDQDTAKQLIKKLKPLLKSVPQEDEKRGWKQWYAKFLKALPFYDDFESLLRMNEPVPRLSEESTSSESEDGNETNMLTNEKRVKEKTDRSFGIFPENNKFRRVCQRLVAPGRGVRPGGVNPNPRLRDGFSIIMFVASVAVIVISCYTTPLYRKEKKYFQNEWNWTLYVDIVFTAIFSIEFVIKAVADGLIFGPCAYMKSLWNIIDFLVLISFWFTVFASLFNGYKILMIVGAVRALRGFRLLTITKRSQDTFQYAIFSAVGRILSASIVAFSLIFPFALWGLNIFRGELGSCLDGVSDKAQCTLEFSQSVFKWNVVTPNTYTEPPLRFNSFKSSMFTLFQIVSLEGWVDLLENLVNTTGVGTVPETFAAPENAIFIVFFNFCSIILILNVFISLVISNYSIKTGVAYLSEQQLGWYEVKKVLSQVKPSQRTDPSKMSPYRRKLYEAFISKNRFFSGSVNFLLTLHLVGLLMETYPAGDEVTTARYIIFMISTSGLFLYNMLSIYAFGPKLFFRNKWNAFRTVVSTGAFIMTVISFVVPRTTIFSNFNKTFLVAILLFIIPKMDILHQLLRFASASLPSLLTIIYTWVVLYVVFAMALNQVFGLTRTGPNTSGNINARTVTKALIMLFRCSFGEGWNYIMEDMTVQWPLCYMGSHSYNSDCGNEGLAYFLFIMWNVLSMYIFLNILVSVVINNFSYVYHGSGPHAAITRDELRKFKRAWSVFDPYGSGYMDPADLQKFLGSLDGVLSYHVYTKDYRIPTLTPQWTWPRSTNPYDIGYDLSALERITGPVDFRRIRDRRQRYDRLCIEAQLNAVDTDDGPKLRFTDVLLRVGYYSRFKDSTCLTLEDYIKRMVLMRRINRIMYNMKLQATVEMTITRLRFKAGTLGTAEAQPAEFDPWTAQNPASENESDNPGDVYSTVSGSNPLDMQRNNMDLE